MTASTVCLTLIAGRMLRQELFDYLTEQNDIVSGFTASDAAGHGPAVRLHTAAERVKGHGDQVIIRIILQDDAARQLLGRLKTAFAGAHLVFWMTPVAEFGTLDDGIW